jgi:hypothetical protein
MIWLLAHPLQTGGAGKGKCLFMQKPATPENGTYKYDIKFFFSLVLWGRGEGSKGTGRGIRFSILPTPF